MVGPPSAAPLLNASVSTPSNNNHHNDNGVMELDVTPPDSPNGHQLHSLDSDIDKPLPRVGLAAPARKTPTPTIAAPPLATSPLPSTSWLPYNWWLFFRTPRMIRLRHMTATEPTHPLPFVLYELTSIAVLLITWACDIVLVWRLSSDPTATKQFYLGLGSLVVTQFAYVRHCWMGHDCQPHGMRHYLFRIMVG
jgi:hypothetical protein